MKTARSFPLIVLALLCLALFPRIAMSQLPTIAYNDTGRNYGDNVGPNQIMVCMTIPTVNPNANPRGPCYSVEPEYAAQLQALLAIEQHSRETRDTVQASAEVLTGLQIEIREANNNQLLAIRDQLITRIETLPLSMVNDENVRQMVRMLVLEEVSAVLSDND